MLILLKNKFQIIKQEKRTKVEFYLKKNQND